MVRPKPPECANVERRVTWGRVVPPAGTLPPPSKGMGAMSARTAPARRRKPPTRRKSAAAKRKKAGGRIPRLDQRQLDLIGLALVAGAVFLAFLIYLGWDGGRAGSWAVEGLRWL